MRTGPFGQSTYAFEYSFPKSKQMEFLRTSCLFLSYLKTNVPVLDMIKISTKNRIEFIFFLTMSNQKLVKHVSLFSFFCLPFFSHAQSLCVCISNCFYFVIQMHVFLPDPDCPYLDKASWCETINARECYTNEDTCCISCKKFIKPQNDYGRFLFKDGVLTSYKNSDQL